MHHFPNLHPGQISYNWRFWIKAIVFFFDRRQWGIKENSVSLESECLVYCHNSETFQLLDMEIWALVSDLFLCYYQPDHLRVSRMAHSLWLPIDSDCQLKLCWNYWVKCCYLGVLGLLNQLKLSGARQRNSGKSSLRIPFCSRGGVRTNCRFPYLLTLQGGWACFICGDEVKGCM